VKESRGASVLLKVRDDAFVTTFIRIGDRWHVKARLLCAQHNVEANF